MRHSGVYDYQVRESGEDFANNVWPGSFENYTKELKSYWSSDQFGFEVGRICGDKTNPLLERLDEEYCIRIVSNYILNYDESNKKIQVEVVSMGDLPTFLEENYFNCTDRFFEDVWDNLLSYGHTNKWGEVVKMKMWEEILPEVEEKMEDEDFIEDNMVEFGSLDKEQMYFLSYWYYPMQSLGWARQDLCEWYVETLGRNFISKMFIDRKLGDTSKTVGTNDAYYIFKMDLFN